MYFYDEYLGHEMWFIPLFTTFLLYFHGCFSKQKTQRSFSLSFIVLLILSTLYNWYYVTEGQLIGPYMITLVAMGVVWVYNVLITGKYMDINGWFLLIQNILTCLLDIVWVIYLWDDPVLRVRYPGWLYVPEPLSYLSLYGVPFWSS